MKKEKNYQFTVRAEESSYPHNQYLWAEETQIQKAMDKVIPFGDSPDTFGKTTYRKEFRERGELIGTASCRHDRIGSLEIKARKGKDAIEIIRQLGLPLPDYKFGEPTTYTVTLHSSNGKGECQTTKKVPVSRHLIGYIIESRGFSFYPRGKYKGKPDGYVETNFIKEEVVKTEGRVTESFDRDNPNSFEITAEDSREGKELANNAAQLFHLPLPFPE